MGEVWIWLVERVGFDDSKYKVFYYVNKEYIRVFYLFIQIGEQFGEFGIMVVYKVNVFEGYLYWWLFVLKIIICKDNLWLFGFDSYVRMLVLEEVRNMVLIKYFYIVVYVVSFEDYCILIGVRRQQRVKVKVIRVD